MLKISADARGDARADHLIAGRVGSERLQEVGGHLARTRTQPSTGSRRTRPPARPVAALGPGNAADSGATAAASRPAARSRGSAAGQSDGRATGPCGQASTATATGPCGQASTATATGPCGQASTATATATGPAHSA
jgi:hypothetical protein